MNVLRSMVVALLTMLVLAACSSGSPAAGVSSVATAVVNLATAGPTLEARFNATAAAGGGINSSTTVSTDDLNTMLAAVPQAKQMQFTANSSPPGAKGGDVSTVSVVASDTSGTLKTLDANAKRALATGLLVAAGTAWPNATITLLMSDPSGSGGQIIGTHAPGGANTVIVP